MKNNIFRKKLLSMEVAAIAATGMLAGSVSALPEVNASFVEVDLASSPFSSIATTLLTDYADGYGGASVELVDLDADGDMDLVLGDRYSGAYLDPRYFENSGSGFTEITDTAVNPIQPLIDQYGWYKNFDFADLDDDGDLDAIMGGGAGWSLQPIYFENVGTSTAPSFEVRDNDKYGCEAKAPVEANLECTDINTDSNPFQIWTSYGSTPAFADIDGDDALEGLVMSINGYQNWFVQDPGDGDDFITQSFYPGGEEKNGGAALSDFSDLYSNAMGAPSFADIDGDGDQDLVIHHYSDSYLNFYPGNGGGYFGEYGGYGTDIANPFVGEVSTNTCTISYSYTGTATFSSGTDTYTGTGTFSGSSGLTCDPAVTPGYNLMFTAFADMDDDGDMDMLVGDQYARNNFEGTPFNNIRYYKNTYGGPRVIQALELEATEDIPFTADMNDYIVDEGAGALTFVVTVGGMTLPNTDGMISATYDQNDANNSPVSLSVEATDEDGNVGVFEGTITVVEVNEPPMQVADFDDITMEIAELVTIDLNDYFEDEEDPLDYTITVNGAEVLHDNGVVSFVFDDSAAANSPLALSLSVSDGVNDPLVVNASITINETSSPLVETDAFIASLDDSQEAADMAAIANAIMEEDEEDDGLLDGGSTSLWALLITPLLWLRRRYRA